jgi:autotransporter-associated beta strand protein
VASIALADGGAGYVGEPYVSIAGGGGSGAAAVANMADDGTGNGTYRVVGVTITSPGFGYTNAPSVAFVSGGNGVTAAVADSVTLAPNTSGGLTKAGSGTLTLSAANTYTGTTTVTEGTLKLANTAALPGGTSVLFNGGTLDLGGYAVTNAVGGKERWRTNPDGRPLAGGEGVLGTTTITLSKRDTWGAYRADVTTAGASDCVVVNAASISVLTLCLVDPGQLTRGRTYTLLSCTGSLTGKLSVANLPDDRWHVVYLADQTVKLAFVDGTLIKLQ